MSHWIDRGQLYEFHQVMLLMSQDNYTDTYSPSAPDSQLAKSLCALEASPGVCEMFSVIAQASLLWASKDNDSPPLGFDFSNSFSFLGLFSAANGEGDGAQRFILWDQHLRLEFHRLIIVTTIAYAHQLEQLAREYKANKKNETRDRLTQVAYFARLLSAVVESNAFMSHLQYLEQKGLLQPPKREDRETTAAFWGGMMRTLDAYENAEADTQREEAKEQGEGAKEQGEGAKEQGEEGEEQLEKEGAKEQGEDVKEQVEEEEEQAEEKEEQADEDRDASDDDIAEEVALEGEVHKIFYPRVVQSRFKRLMGYLGAKRILEHYCYKTRRPIKIKLLEMQIPQFSQPSWLELQRIMQEAVAHHGKPIDLNLNADGTGMPSFFKYIEDFVQRPNVIDGRSNRIFHTFTSIIKATWNLSLEMVTTPKGDSDSLYYAPLHCETILAAFARCFKIDPADVISGELAQIVQVCLTGCLYHKPIADLFHVVARS